MSNHPCLIEANVPIVGALVVGCTQCLIIDVGGVADEAGEGCCSAVGDGGEHLVLKVIGLNVLRIGIAEFTSTLLACLWHP